MYKHYFGFNERPFQLVPNPEYLFLSKSHEEAIAYLNYTISHGEGFVAITGEVGAGKTTLCRAFLDNLDKDVAVAYIFNPKLSAMELLRAINDEFGLPSSADNLKDLIDVLNTFLLDEKTRESTAILLIDEAQNLSLEVLEQLRLLSNLESNTRKLLQIILVGQPELRKKLDSYELRQFNQRITLSWYLTPLSSGETRDYIRHRVDIAARKRDDRFSGRACAVIYRHSRGIPRLINIACDQSLLTAYGLNRQKVNWSIARASIKELTKRGYDSRPSLRRMTLATVSLAILCVLFIALFLYYGPLSSSFGNPSDASNPGKVQRAAVVSTIPAPAPQTQPDPQPMTSLIANPDSHSSRSGALRKTLSLWAARFRDNYHLRSLESDEQFFYQAARYNDFEVLEVNRDLDLLKKLNLPAVMQFYVPGDDTPRYMTLTNIGRDKMTLEGGAEDQPLFVSPVEIETYWSGASYVFWKNAFNQPAHLPVHSSRESVVTLKMMLRDIGFNQVEVNASYDAVAMAAIRKIQARHGIRTDGIVGPLTKIVVYNELNQVSIPYIDGEKK